VTPGVRNNLVYLAFRIVKEPAVAESLVADAITQTAQRADPTRPETFLGYLKLVLRNKAFDWLKRWKRQRTYLEDTRGRTTIRSAYSEVVSREAIQLFRDALETLTRRERRAIIMRVVEELGYADIARQLRVTPVAAKTIVFRAKLRLDEWIKYMRAV
jgi:RNA polymerase sigma factor (sigma-70 family)